MNAKFLSPAVERILSLLLRCRPDSTGWTALCPAHEDHTASLHVAVGDDGRALLHCRAGCPIAAILAALHLEPRDLFVVPTSERHRSSSRSGDRGSARNRSQASKRFEPKRAQELWMAALMRAVDDASLDTDREVFEYVARRGLAVAREMRLFGVVSNEIAKRFELSTWSRGGYRLCVALRDERGNVVNVQARCIRENHVKLLVPAGSPVRGTVFANEPGVALLRREHFRGPVFYGEGLTDCLALSISTNTPVLTAPGTGNVLHGIGAWADGADVFLAVDNDAAGEAVVPAAARRLFEFGARRVIRVRWPAGCKDACEALAALGSVLLKVRLHQLVEEGPCGDHIAL